MVLMNHKWDRLLELFFEFPSDSFSVREIARKTKIPSSTVQRYLNELKKIGVITSENKANITSYFKFLKTFFIIDKMHKIGLIDHLEKELVPETVIVFGSIRKGEYDHESDIDLFVASTKKVRIDLKKFEKKLGHEIQLFVEKDIKDLQHHLLNNVLNGIKLSGYFKIIDGK